MNRPTANPCQVLILPGWQDSSPAHWQSVWQAQHGYERLMQHDWMHPLRGDWITRLEDRLLLNSEHSAHILYRLEAENASKMASTTATDLASPQIVFVAHSLGCHLAAAWAALSKNTHRVRGALLVAPPDCQREDFPIEMKSWRNPVLQKLPFPSICVISSNDPFSALQRGRDMTQAWGSECIEIGDRGHINAESGLLDWPQGQALLAKLQG
jgi:uncharacterized protein